MNKKIVIKNVLSSLLYQVILLIYGFIVPILIIEKFGSDVNGLVSSISQFLAYIILLEGGIGPVIKNALFKPIVEKKKDEISDILGTTSRFFKKIAIVFIVYLLLLCIFYPYFVVDKFSHVYTISLILIISISRFFEYFLGITYKLYLQSDQKNYIIDYLGIITHVLNLAIIYCLIKCNLSIQIVKLVSALIYVIEPIFLKIYVERKIGIKTNKKSQYVLTKKWDGLSHHIAATVQSNTDVIVLTIFSNLANVSIYSVYSLVTNGVRSIIISLTNGIDSFFGKQMANNNSINDKFDRYCLAFYTITTIILGCALLLIMPFITIYTKNITDANYIQTSFAYILIFAEFNYVIRYPYSTLTYAKGYFRETKVPAIIEPVVNIILSVVLVRRLGLIGVAIGTLISMTIRSYGFVHFVSRKILHRPVLKSLKIIILSFIELCIIFTAIIPLKRVVIPGYFEWLFWAFIIGMDVSVFVLMINVLVYKNDVIRLIRNFKRRKK